MKKIQLGGYRKGGVISGYALVDDNDFEELNKFRWSVMKNGKTSYAHRKSSLDNKQLTILMHSQIMQTPKGKDVDHIDGNGFNNQRTNLRICTRAENCKNRGKNSNNTSGLKGVSWNKRDKKWVAKIRLNGKTINLGYFLTKELASEAYIAACIQYHGEFANY